MDNDEPAIKQAVSYPELTLDELLSILNLTIKKDDTNKLVTFLCELSAYTEDAQFNISFNAPSSTGKSYIPTEIARLFPEEDVMEIGYCSPTAFFHDMGIRSKEDTTIYVNLERKILIFLDQPDPTLLSRLRPLLSHDKKEINVKITDKAKGGGMRTKNIMLVGYPSVIFCTAGLTIDEQESTRFLLLSPEINEEKVHQGVVESISRSIDTEAYYKQLDSNPERTNLKSRIRAIRDSRITSIIIPSSEQFKTRFFESVKHLLPRHQRDVKRLISLIKAFGLLNLWQRERRDGAVVVHERDIDLAFKIWGRMSVSQEHNLPPYVYDIYRDVFIPLWKEVRGDGVEPVGITYTHILNKHYLVYGKMLDVHQLRQQIIPMLETAGLVAKDKDPDDKRRTLIYPTLVTNDNNEESWGVPSSVMEGEMTNADINKILNS